MNKAKMLAQYIKDWFKFLSQDEFQAFAVIVVLISIFKIIGFIDTAFFEKVFIYGMALAFGDNTISTVSQLLKK